MKRRFRLIANQPYRNLIKKTEYELLSEAEKRRYEDIVEIQRLLAEGFASVQIKDILHTTYNRIRRYATGDPLKLCGFRSDKESEADRYKAEIIAMLEQNISFKAALKQLESLGYNGKRTSFEVYCRKLIAELDIQYKPRRNILGISVTEINPAPAKRYISCKDFLHYLWSGKEINPDDAAAVINKYPAISEIQQCIIDFRKIYNVKSIPLLESFIKTYSSIGIKPLQSFASGLKTDLEAVKNSVTSELSNGFVEGNNNKIKLIKRSMFGRAKIDLLRIKVVFSR